MSDGEHQTEAEYVRAARKRSREERQKQRHTIHLADGTRIEVFGDRYDVHLPNPISVHRKQWVIALSAIDEVERTLLFTSYAPVRDALEKAFRTIPQIVSMEDD